jgi:hypothetical protein
MMTFVVSSDVNECAKALDYRRLGKQRVEAYQILRTLRGHSHGWKNHPAVKMWNGYENALAMYMNAMIDEWVARGYKNTMIKEKIEDTAPKFPWWFNWEPLHNSHKASLNRKNSTYYNFDVEPCFMNHGYIWPTLVPYKRRQFLHLCCLADCLPFQLQAVHI